jgi:hypothetical protein
MSFKDCTAGRLRVYSYEEVLCSSEHDMGVECMFIISVTYEIMGVVGNISMCRALIQNRSQHIFAACHFCMKAGHHERDFCIPGQYLSEPLLEVR